MAAGLRKLRTLGRMLLPLGVHELQRRYALRNALPSDVRETIARNAEVKNRHKGERCFILGNGPSAKQLDLERLKGEVVFSVSNGYLHKGYNVFAPRYHCLPQVTRDRMSDEDMVRWFTEMHERIGEAELFLSTQDMEIVLRRRLFPGRRVRYLHLQESFDDIASTDIIDISRPTPRVESVPVMALMIAMYMGFSEIVLLGVDHDHFLTAQYTYAFDLTMQQGKDSTVGRGDVVTLSRHDDFQSLARLWRQYRCLSQIAKAQHVRIFNSTGGGALDEFPTVPLKAWFAR